MISFFAVRVLSLLWYKVLRISYGSCASLSVLVLYTKQFNILRVVVNYFPILHHCAPFWIDYINYRFHFLLLPLFFIFSFISKSHCFSFRFFCFFCNIISCVQSNICLVDVRTRYTCNVGSLNATAYSKFGKILFGLYRPYRLNLDSKLYWSPKFSSYLVTFWASFPMESACFT